MSRQFGNPSQGRPSCNLNREHINFVRLVASFCILRLFANHIACRTNVTMSVSFGGRVWNIDPFDINLGPVNPGSSLCIGAIVEWKEYDPPAPNWIFGMTFLASRPFFASNDFLTKSSRKMYTLSFLRTRSLLDLLNWQLVQVRL
jgi:hypothetical protein